MINGANVMQRKLPSLPPAPINFERGKPSYCRLLRYGKPKKGEYFLSGSKAEAWLAKNDMDVRYWIVERTKSVSHVYIWETHHCPKCMSTDIEEMASVKWIEDVQQYRISDVSQPCICNACGLTSETTTVKTVDARTQ